MYPCTRFPHPSPLLEVYPGERERGLLDDRVLQRESEPLQGEVLVLSDHLRVRARLVLVNHGGGDKPNPTPRNKMDSLGLSLIFI